MPDSREAAQDSRQDTSLRTTQENLGSSSLTDGHTLSKESPGHVLDLSSPEKAKDAQPNSAACDLGEQEPVVTTERLLFWPKGPREACARLGPPAVTALNVRQCGSSARLLPFL